MKTPYLSRLGTLVAVGFALTSAAAYANTTYDLSLTYVSSNGGASPVSGNGLLVLDTPIPATGSFTYETTNDGGFDGPNDGIIESLSVTLSNGNTYSTTSTNGAEIGFFNDTIESLSFNYYVNNIAFAIGIGEGGVSGPSYTFSSNYGASAANGHVTLTAAPEPGSMLLMGAALLGLAAFPTRRALRAKV